MFRATQKIKTWLIACLMAVVTALVAVSTCLLPTSTVVNAAEEWKLVKNVNDLAIGNEIIIAAKSSNVAMSTKQNTNNRGQAAITKSSDKSTLTDAPSSSVQIITLQAGTTSGTFAFYTGSGYLYAAGGTGKNNYLKTQSSLTAASSWTISITSAGVATVKTADSTVARHTLMHNSSSSLFSCYASGQAAIVIYKLVTADEPNCEHTDTEFVYNEGKGTHNEVCTECEWKVAENVPCTEKVSYTEGVGTHTKTTTCEVCNGTISTQTATCEYNEVVTPPTVEAGGYTTYTCKYCGYSYDDDFTPALGQTEATVTYNVPVGVAAIEPVTVDINSTVKLPTLESPVGYTFVGWTTTEYDTAVETQPEVFTGEYTVTADVQMYALYSKTVAGGDAWTLVENAASLAVGDKIVIAASELEESLSTNQKTNNRGTTSIKKSGNTITLSDDVQIITLVAGETSGTFGFYTGSGYLYAASNSSNHLKTQAELDSNGSWNITISNGVASIVAKGSNSRNIMQHNPNNGSPLISCYDTAKYNQLAVYKLISSSTTTYATLDKITAINGASITITDDLTVNYYVGLEEQHQGAQMKFTMNGETTTVDGVEQTDGRYKYSFENIAPQQMCDNIKAELIFDGAVLASIEEYSIKQYAQNKLVGANEKLQRLLSDLLYYGDEAQKYCDMEATTSSGVEGLAEKATATPNETQLTIDEAQLPAWFGAAGLKFDNVNQLYVRVDGDLEGVTVTVTKNNGEPVEFEAKGALYYTDGVVATEFDTVYTFVLSVNGQELQTLTYSVNSYVYAMKNNANMKDLATALYNYGLAAEAYVAE